MALKTSLIEGVVQDARGRPVAGARVSWAHAPMPVPDMAVLTDGQGRFVLSAPAPGPYKLRADSDAQGFVEQALQAVGKPVQVTLTMPR